MRSRTATRRQWAPCVAAPLSDYAWRRLRARAAVRAGLITERSRDSELVTLGGRYTDHRSCWTRSSSDSCSYWMLSRREKVYLLRLLRDGVMAVSNVRRLLPGANSIGALGNEMPSMSSTSQLYENSPWTYEFIQHVAALAEHLPCLVAGAWLSARGPGPQSTDAKAAICRPSAQHINRCQHT